MPKAKTSRRRVSANHKRRNQIVLEFIKLQIAGFIPFGGTYVISFILDKLLSVDEFQSLLIATVLANMLFFVVNDRWVFNQTRKKRQTGANAWRFVIFMSFSALLTFNITWQLRQQFHLSLYIGQFISAGLSIIWTFPGLHFWVFAPTKHRSTT